MKGQDVATPEDIAQWMVEQVNDHSLYQTSAAYQIADRFGEEFTYRNENGNRAIDPKVLKAFRALTEDAVVWHRRGRYWRKREEWDRAKGRQVG